MNSPLDDISFTLGAISADIAVLKSQGERRDRQFESLDTKVTEVKECVKPLVEDLVWMKPQVRHYRTWRGRAAWMGSAIVAAFGLAGGAIANFVTKKYLS